MEKLKNRLAELGFMARTGTKLKIIDEPVEPIVIRYKDIFIEVLLDENGDPQDFGWSRSATMFHTPIREMLVAQPNPLQESTPNE